MICFKQHNNNENSNSEIFGFMFCGLLHVKLVWMPSVCYNPNYYLQNRVYLYLVPLFLNEIGNLLVYVGVLFATSVCRLLSLSG